MLPLKPLAQDQRTLAERQWNAGLKPTKPQLPADVGLFGDDHLQLDLVEMLQTEADTPEQCSAPYLNSWCVVCGAPPGQCWYN